MSRTQTDARAYRAKARGGKASRHAGGQYVKLQPFDSGGSPHCPSETRLRRRQRHAAMLRNCAVDALCREGCICGYVKMIKNSNGVQFEAAWVDYVMSDDISLVRHANNYSDTEFYEDLRKFDLAKMRNWDTWTQSEWDLYSRLVTMICEDPDFNRR